MSNKNERKDILDAFEVVAIDDIILFLETPVNFDKIYSQQTLINHYTETNLSLKELLVSYSQYCLEPENPYSLDLRLFKNDKVTIDNDKIYISRGKACREFIKQNIAGIDKHFFDFIQKDLSINLEHKLKTKELIELNKNKKYKVDVNKIRELFNTPINFHISSRDKNEISSVQTFNPVSNPSFFSLKLTKCLLIFLQNNKLQSKYKTKLLDNYSNNLSYNPSIFFLEKDSLEFIKHSASVFAILSFLPDINNPDIEHPKRNYFYLEQVQNVSLESIKTLFSQYYALESNCLLSLSTIKKMIESDDLIEFLSIFLKS